MRMRQPDCESWFVYYLRTKISEQISLRFNQVFFLDSFGITTPKFLFVYNRRTLSCMELNNIQNFVNIYLKKK